MQAYGYFALNNFKIGTKKPNPNSNTLLGGEPDSIANQSPQSRATHLKLETIEYLLIFFPGPLETKNHNCLPITRYVPITTLNVGDDKISSYDMKIIMRS